MSISNSDELNMLLKPPPSVMQVSRFLTDIQQRLRLQASTGRPSSMTMVRLDTLPSPTDAEIGSALLKRHGLGIFEIGEFLTWLNPWRQDERAMEHALPEMTFFSPPLPLLAQEPGLLPAADTRARPRPRLEARQPRVSRAAAPTPATPGPRRHAAPSPTAPKTITPAAQVAARQQTAERPAVAASPRPRSIAVAPIQHLSFANRVARPGSQSRTGMLTGTLLIVGKPVLARPRLSPGGQPALRVTGIYSVLSPLYQTLAVSMGMPGEAATAGKARPRLARLPLAGYLLPAQALGSPTGLLREAAPLPGALAGPGRAADDAPTGRATVYRRTAFPTSASWMPRWGGRPLLPVNAAAFLLPGQAAAVADQPLAPGALLPHASLSQLTLIAPSLQPAAQAHQDAPAAVAGKIGAHEALDARRFAAMRQTLPDDAQLIYPALPREQLPAGAVNLRLAQPMVARLLQDGYATPPAVPSVSRPDGAHAMAIGGRPFDFLALPARVASGHGAPTGLRERHTIRPAASRPLQRASSAPARTQSAPSASIHLTKRRLARHAPLAISTQNRSALPTPGTMSAVTPSGQAAYAGPSVTYRAAMPAPAWQPLALRQPTLTRATSAATAVQPAAGLPPLAPPHAGRSMTTADAGQPTMAFSALRSPGASEGTASTPGRRATPSATGIPRAGRAATMPTTSHAPLPSSSFVQRMLPHRQAPAAIAARSMGTPATEMSTPALHLSPARAPQPASGSRPYAPSSGAAAMVRPFVPRLPLVGSAPLRAFPAATSITGAPRAGTMSPSAWPSSPTHSASSFDGGMPGAFPAEPPVRPADAPSLSFQPGQRSPANAPLTTFPAQPAVPRLIRMAGAAAPAPQPALGRPAPGRGASMMSGASGSASAAWPTATPRPFLSGHSLPGSAPSGSSFASSPPIAGPQRAAAALTPALPLPLARRGQPSGGSMKVSSTLVSRAPRMLYTPLSPAVPSRALQPAIQRSTSNVQQRSDTVERNKPSAGAPPHSEEGQQSLDAVAVNTLATEVWSLLKRRFSAEADRRGRW